MFRPDRSIRAIWVVLSKPLPNVGPNRDWPRRAWEPWNLSPSVATSVFCQCSDGSSVACDEACDVDLVKSTYVTVTATTTFTPVTPRIIPGFPDTIDLSGEVTLRTN